MKLYHGTVDANLPAIQASGLIPNGNKGADHWGFLRYGSAPENRNSVFLTNDPKAAGGFAWIAADIHPEAKPVVVTVELPADAAARLVDDEEAGPYAFRYPGKIDPAWIKATEPAGRNARGSIHGGGVMEILFGDDAPLFNV